MSYPVCTAFTNLPSCQSPVAAPVELLVRRLMDWKSLHASAPALRDALYDIINGDGGALHRAFGAHGQLKVAEDFAGRAEQLLRTVRTYAGADEVGDYESLEELFVRVVRTVDGLIAWLEYTDSELRPRPGAPHAVTSAPTPAPPIAAPTSSHPPHATATPAVVAGATPIAPAAVPPASSRQPSRRKTAGAPRSLTVDSGTGTVEYRGKRLKLPPNLGFRILAFLAEHPAMLRTYSDVIRGVWEQDADPGNHAVDVHVSKLRKVLENQPSNRRIWSDLASRIRCRHQHWQIELSSDASVP